MHSGDEDVSYFFIQKETYSYSKENMFLWRKGYYYTHLILRSKTGIFMNCIPFEGFSRLIRIHFQCLHLVRWIPNSEARSWEKTGLISHCGARRKNWAKKKPSQITLTGQKKSWQCPTLPQGHPCSTIGAGGLYYRVRYGIGCFPSAIVARKSITSP